MERQNQNDELYPIAVLIDELKAGNLRFTPQAHSANESSARRCAPPTQRYTSIIYNSFGPWG